MSILSFVRRAALATLFFSAACGAEGDPFDNYSLTQAVIPGPRLAEERGQLTPGDPVIVYRLDGAELRIELEAADEVELRGGGGVTIPYAEIEAVRYIPAESYDLAGRTGGGVAAIFAAIGAIIMAAAGLFG